MKINNKHPRILLCAPTNFLKRYCHHDFIDQVLAITYKNMDIVLCDNSASINYSKKITRETGIKCLWCNPVGRNSIVYITESQERLRNYAIDNKYDYMFWLETDVFVPYKKIIELLLHHNRPVVCALYHILTGNSSHLMIQQLSDDKRYQVSYNVTAPYDANFIDGTLKKIFHGGLGCCLVRRDVFTKIPFRYQLGIASHSDTFFYHDLHKHNIPVYADTSIICEHRNQDWNKLKNI